MNVAYVFATSGHTASYTLGKMILPQLEEGRHGVEVVGIMSALCACPYRGRRCRA
jgi:hypothetical protein